MAEKVEKPSPGTAVSSPEAAAAARELEILHPAREVVIAGGRVLTVREYRFTEGLKVMAAAKPFIEALYALVAPKGIRPGFQQIEELLAEHQGHVLTLIAKAADVKVSWLETLSDEDGYRLMQEWWIVNSGFFIRRVMQRVATARAVAKLDGDTSTAC